jgi:hypothetical protein
MLIMVYLVTLTANGGNSTKAATALPHEAPAEVGERSAAGLHSTRVLSEYPVRLGGVTSIALVAFMALANFDYAIKLLSLPELWCTRT